MSTSPKPAEAAESRPWFLRKEDGAVYGPADQARMIAWAKAGRIAPDDHVSRDRLSWAPAPAFSDLDLFWVIESPGGERVGPLHIDACRALAREGQIEIGAVLHNTRTGTRVVLEEEPEEDPPATVAPAESPADTTGPDVPPAWSMMARERDHSVDEARRWRTLYEAERKNSAETEAAATERIRTLEQEIIRLQTVNEKASAEILQLRKVLKTRSEEGGTTADALPEIHYELSRRFEDLSRRYDEKTAESAAQAETCETLRREKNEQEERDRNALRREREEADAIRRNQAELEQAYAEAVRTLREINDRFIRYRAGPGSGTEAATPKTGPRPSPAASSRSDRGTPPSAGPRIRLTR